jgi:hypothetical protein
MVAQDKKRSDLAKPLQKGYIAPGFWYLAITYPQDVGLQIKRLARQLQLAPSFVRVKAHPYIAPLMWVHCTVPVEKRLFEELFLECACLNQRRACPPMFQHSALVYSCDVAGVNMMYCKHGIPVFIGEFVTMVRGAFADTPCTHVSHSLLDNQPSGYRVCVPIGATRIPGVFQCQMYFSAPFVPSTLHLMYYREGYGFRSVLAQSL